MAEEGRIHMLYVFWSILPIFPSSTCSCSVLQKILDFWCNRYTRQWSIDTFNVQSLHVVTYNKQDQYVFKSEVLFLLFLACAYPD